MNFSEIQEIFKDADLTIIKNIIYFDSWASYEEHDGILIFRAIDDSIQLVPFGSSVMAEENLDTFRDMREISYKEALEKIESMAIAIEESYETR